MILECSTSGQLILAPEIGGSLDGQGRVAYDEAYSLSGGLALFENFEDTIQRDPETDESSSADITAAAGSQRTAASKQRSTLQYEDAVDEQLVKAARAGDQHAFGELSDRYATMVQQRIMKIVRNREDAEDVLQDALLKAYYHLDQFRGSSKFSTWLNRIAINSALMLLRKRRRTSETSFDRSDDEGQSWDTWDFPDPSPSAEQLYAGLQTSKLVSHAMQQLPVELRSIVDRYHDKECSTKEVADAMGITVTAVKSRLYRARRRLRAVMCKRNVSIVDMEY